jgi:hypothetical protein
VPSKHKALSSNPSTIKKKEKEMQSAVLELIRMGPETLQLKLLLGSGMGK